MSPGKVAAFLQQTADPQPCPDTLPDGVPSTFVGVDDEQGADPARASPGHNSWYGAGEVNTLAAVTHGP